MVQKLIHEDVALVSSFIEFVISSYSCSKLLQVFRHDIWMEKYAPLEISGLADWHIFERWIIACQVCCPIFLEGLGSIIEQNVTEGDRIDFRILLFYFNSLENRKVSPCRIELSGYCANSYYVYDDLEFILADPE